MKVIIINQPSPETEKIFYRALYKILSQAEIKKPNEPKGA